MTIRDEIRAALAAMAEHREAIAEADVLDLRDIHPAEEPMELVAVDGSYTFLWNFGSMWLAVVRAAAVRYAMAEGGYRLRPPPLLADRAIVVSTWEDIATRQGELHQRLYEATRGRGEQHREMANEFRKHVEGELALRVAQEHQGVLVALDGSLAAVPRELDHLEDVVAACEDNGNVLVGVSKDSFLHAFGRTLPDEQVLRTYGGSAYVRVPADFEKAQRGLLHGDVYFARLHPQAGKWFRVDVGTRRDDPDVVFGHLAAHARSGLSLGYPFGLMEAHRVAVMIRQFRDLLEGEILKECGRLGLPMGDVVAGLTATEGRRRGAFHEHLDAFARDVK